MACMMLPGCARSCGGASVFYYWCWRLEHAARRPNLARTAAVERMPAAQAEQPEVADVEEAAARRDPRADRAAVAAPVAARRIRSGVPVASPAPAPAMSAAVPASPARRRTAEPARLNWAARPAAEAPAGVAARRARAAEVATVAARADAAESGGGTGGTGGAAVCGARASRAASFASTQLWRHGSAVQSAPRWRPMSDRMDVSGFLQYLTDTGARLRGATVHASRSFLHHAARVVRRHGHLRVPPGKRLPDRRRMRPHQRRRSHLSIGLTKSKGTTMRELTTSNRSGFVARAEQLAAIVTLTIMIAGGCGSVNSAGGDAAAGASGQGGNAGNGASGAAGSGGTSAGRGGGGGFAGSTGGGAGGDGCGPGYPVGSSRPAGDGCNGCNCIAPGTWVCSTASCPIGGAGGGGTTGGGGGVAGAGGSAGRGGAGGSAGSTGSGGRGGGSGGSAGGGGAGGTTSPCQTVLALDRSCTTAADCFAGAHVTNCCGTAQYVGFRNSVKTAFQTLEAACDATYPACECPIRQPTTDDGSALGFGDEPGVTCLQGKCTTFVPDCGQPCDSGSTCFSCVNHQQMFAACTTMCTGNTQCQDPSLPLCQMGMSGNTAGKFCTAANVACDTK